MSVPMSETASDPRQPSRFEKKANISQLSQVRTAMAAGKSRAAASPRWILRLGGSLPSRGISLEARLRFAETAVMTERQADTSDEGFSYNTHLNILHSPLEVIDVPRLVDQCEQQWYNQTLCQVDESVVRLGVVEGEYHWHKHENEDEFFYVVSGRFLIDLEDRTVELTAGKGFVVPKGARHRPRAPERTVILMVERAGIVPTGSS